MTPSRLLTPGLDLQRAEAPRPGRPLNRGDAHGATGPELARVDNPGGTSRCAGGAMRPPPRRDRAADTRSVPERKKILVVEDDVDLRATLRFALETERYEVDSAG